MIGEAVQVTQNGRNVSHLVVEFPGLLFTTLELYPIVQNKLNASIFDEHNEDHGQFAFKQISPNAWAGIVASTLNTYERNAQTINTAWQETKGLLKRLERNK